MVRFSFIVVIAVLSFAWCEASVEMHNPFYCYAQDPIRPQTRMFSIISTYETNRGRNLVDPHVSSCTPSKFWLVARHGTRLPSRADISSMLEVNHRIQRDTLRNYEAGRSTLCSADVELLRSWRFDLNITLEREQYLTVAGWNEFQGLAQRYQAAFPTLLPPTYTPGHYFFRTAFTQRARGSMRAFADGLFGFNGFEQVQFAETPNLDLLLRPHDFCPALSEINSEQTEQAAFVEGPEYQTMLTRVSAKLGFHGSESLRASDVATVNNICRFEQIWDINSTSPWCAAFSVADHQVLEYFEDLFFYYRFGYGRPTHRTLFENINCFVMQDLLQFIQSDDPTDHKVRLFGGHTATMQLLVVTFGIFIDEEPLTRYNFAHQINRQWRTSRLAPKGTNLVIVKYECADDNNDILFLHNERPLQIPGCQSNGICKQSFVLERFSRFLNVNCENLFCSN